MRKLICFAVLTVFLAGCAGGGFDGLRDTVSGLVGDYDHMVENGLFIESDETDRVISTPAALPTRRGNLPGVRSMLELSGNNSFVRATRLERYSQDILDRLLEGWPGETGNLRIFIMSSPVFQGRASPDGDILLNMGVFETLQSNDTLGESALAGLIAHEAAHILLQHFDRQETVTAHSRALELAARSAIFAAALSDLDIERVGSRVQLRRLNSDRAQDIVHNTAATYLIAWEFVDTAWNPAWSRTQEIEADLLGVDLLVCAGYDPSGLVEVFEAYINEANSRRLQIEDVSERYRETVEREIDTGNVFVLMQVLPQLFVDFAIAGLQDLRAELRTLHEAFDIRQELVQTYYNTYYLEDRPDSGRGCSVDIASLGPQDDDWDQLSRVSSVSNTINNYGAANSALEAVENEVPDLRKAVSDARRSITWPTARSAFPRFANYRTEIARGNYRLANRHLDAVGPQEIPSRLINELRIKAALANENLALALRLLERAEVEIGYEEIYFPVRILVHRVRGEDAQAEAVFQRCQQLDAPTEFTDQCAVNMGREPDTTFRNPIEWLGLF